MMKKRVVSSRARLPLGASFGSLFKCFLGALFNFSGEVYRVPPSQLIRPLLFGRTLALSLSLFVYELLSFVVYRSAESRALEEASPFHVSPTRVVR